MRSFGMNGSDIRSRFGRGAALAALVWTGMAGAGAQAQTFDDRPSTFAPILNIIGLGKDDDEKPTIDFRERPKLVVPKGADLPPPQTGGAQRAANWPVDQDVSRQRAAAAAARAPRVISLNERTTMTPAELQKGRSDAPETSGELCDTRISGTPDCSALTPAQKLKQVFSLSGDGPKEDRDVSRPGVEPDRQYLTEPPKGYRAATTVVEVKQRGPVRPYEAPSASEFSRGVDPNRPRD
jgi:hypothetical protein